MTRNLNVLGLALMALFAMSAVAASAASAETEGYIERGSNGDVTLTGEDTGVAQNRLTVGTDFTECPGSTYTGHAITTPSQTASGLKHQFLANGATEITVTPHYKQTQTGGTPNCDATGGLSATIAMNGCDYRFYDFTTTGGVAGTYGFKTDLVCPTGKVVEVKIYSGHGHTFQICQENVTPGTGFTGGHATNGSGGHINLSGTVTGFIVHKSGACGTEEVKNGSYDLDVTVKAHDTLGNNVGISISDTGQTVGYLELEPSNDVTLTGEDTGVAQNRLTVGTDFTECPGSTYTGHAITTPSQTASGLKHQFLANGATEITVTPHYKQTQTGGTANCDATLGTSATVAMNGCDYRFYDFTTTGGVAGTYGFTADLVCPTGKVVEVKIYSR